MGRRGGLALFVTVMALLAVAPVTAWPRLQRPVRRRQPLVPCLFIFGDSLVDNGNNNGIPTLARANYVPYGADFPQGVTGRFTNGRTYVDVLGQLLGFRGYIPPAATTSGRAVLQGVNYASGGAGIRDETGNNLGGHTPFRLQVARFGETAAELRRSVFGGNAQALSQQLSKCIFYSGVGSNDYLNNYFMPISYTTASAYSPRAYAAALLRDYSSYLTELHRVGARKIAVTGVGPIGCIPYELARYRRSRGGSRCNETINAAVLEFNSGLRQLVQRFNRGALPGAKFVYLDSYRSTTELTSKARSYGFTEINRGCCGVGRNNGQITCLPLQPPCRNHRGYFFWDAFHPTEAANLILANISFASNSQSFAYPFNLERLAKL